MAMRDIRHQMPQFNPNAFPRKAHQPYPKMLNERDENGVLKPVLFHGRNVIVNSPGEEAQMREKLGLKSKSTPIEPKEEESPPVAAEEAEKPKKPGPKPKKKDD